VSEPTRPEPVTLLFDVRSPWCYQTSRWLRRLAALGEVTLSWGVFSLEVVNLHAGEDPVGYDAEYGPALRVALALRDDRGQQAIGDFYAAFGTRMWQTPAPAGPVPADTAPARPVLADTAPAGPVPADTEPAGPALADTAQLPDVPELTRQALADIGIDPGYADKVLADEASWTAVLDEHRRWADRRVFGVPTLLIGDDTGSGGRAQHVVFGPVLRTLPSDGDGIALWRHLRGLAVLGTVFELKRFKSLQSRADLPNAVARANLRVADMRAARALMGPDGPCEGASLEWAMGRVRAQRVAAPAGAAAPAAPAASAGEEA
jgi:DSBA-like thioredoxin domain